MNLIDAVTIIILLGLIAVAVIYKYNQERNGEKSTNKAIDEFCENHKIAILILFMVIFFVSVIFRFGVFPETVFVDEAGTIFDANSIAKFGVDRYLIKCPVYLINFGGGQSALLCYLMVVFIKIFGSNIISYRLPMLLAYLIGVIASYRLFVKTKDKKTALLFTFLAITLPWNITTARRALDCNLYAGMFMLDLFLLNLAKKNYQYIIAGISVGLTLYTYSISWITLPFFLLFWIIYMMYLNRINIKQIILLAIPIIVFAIPLVLFLLINHGMIPEINIGFFSIPKMLVYREGEISILKIFKYGWESILTLLGYENTIYPAYIPLVLLGFGISVVNAIKKIRKKEYDIGTIITIGFVLILLGILTTRNQTPNKLNVLYFPLMYFVAIALIEMFNNFPKLFVVSIIVVCVLFIDFEYFYYTAIETSLETSIYDDNSYYKLVDKIEQIDELKEIEKYVYIYKAEPHIYQLYAKTMSPYDYDKNKETNKIRVKRLGEYHYYNFVNGKEEFYHQDFNKENAIVIISIILNNDEKYLQEKFDKEIVYKDMVIYANEEIGDKIQNVL